MNRQNIMESFFEQQQKKKPIIGVAVGNGRSAKQAADGGADFLFVLNAGRFRMAGVPSTAATLPFANANDMVYQFGKDEIIPRVKNRPIIFGSCAQDPTHTHDEIIRMAINGGFHGINNFPTVSLIDGQYRKFLEENEEGYQAEVDLMKKAIERGLFTVAFSVTLDEALAMASIGVDVLCIHFGWTALHHQESMLNEYVDSLIDRTQIITHEVAKINPELLVMIYGGSFVKNTQVMARFFKETSISGYIGGSVFEVFPTENTIKDATMQFKQFNHYIELEEENKILKSHLLSKEGVKNILGNSTPILKLISFIEKTAQYDNNILIRGESGSGKDLVAKAIHYNSNRAAYPFVKLNLVSIPSFNVEQELFGIEKNGEVMIGKFESAHHGTLFLDNIHELDANMQSKLLRVIQDQSFERVGGSKTIEVDVRIISTATTNVKSMVESGLFREDLYYLLNVLVIDTPALRSHKEDIPVYVETFVERLNEKYNRKISVSSDVVQIFMKYDWPGNIRELKNVLERGAILCENDHIDLTCLPTSMGPVMPEDVSLNYIKKSADIIEKEMLQRELEKAHWNQTKVAGMLGITRRTLYNKIKKYQLNEKNTKK